MCMEGCTGRQSRVSVHSLKHPLYNYRRPQGWSPLLLTFMQLNFPPHCLSSPPARLPLASGPLPHPECRFTRRVLQRSNVYVLLLYWRSIVPTCIQCVQSLSPCAFTTPVCVASLTSSCLHARTSQYIPPGTVGLDLIIPATST